MPKFLTVLTGWSIFSRSALVCCLLCCLLCRTADAEPVTNVDFVVVSGRHDMNMDAEPWQTKYNSYPVGRLLFWTVIFDDTQTRGEIYRSESGHIGFIKQVAGGEVFLIANESGGPASWLLDTSTIHAEWTSSQTYFARPPHVWNKPYYDIFATSGVGNRGSLWNTTDGVISANFTLLGYVGNVSFAWRNFNLQSYTYSGVCPLVRFDPLDNGTFQNQVKAPFSYYAAYATWRSPLLDVPLDFFKMMRDRKWWIRGEFAVNSTGITGIGYGTGDQGVSGQTASGGSGGSGGGGGITTLPGAIDDPPQTPLGLNGRWVYDPETKLWNWIGDIADNANQINPFDNSVMPENQERGAAQEATLRQVKDGIDGLAKEETLKKVYMSMEEFAKQQNLRTGELQAMIDNGVVSIVDGMVQYWEGKNLAPKLDSIKSSVDESADRVVQSQSATRQQVELIKDTTGSIRDSTAATAGALGPRGALVLSINTVGDTVSTIGDSIVNAVGDIDVPENPTTDEQDKEEVDISEPELSQFDGWLTLEFPQINIPRVTNFSDYDIGVMGWEIPFSYFSQSNGAWYNVAIFRVRTILAWLVYLSATLGVCKAMGAGV